MYEPSPPAVVQMAEQTAEQLIDTARQAYSELERPTVPRKAKIQNAVAGVYFLRAQGTGLVKIGYSQDIRKRMATASVWCPHQLELIAVIPGGRKRESAIHSHLISSRVIGEWFRETPELIEIANNGALDVGLAPIGTTPVVVQTPVGLAEFVRKQLLAMLLRNPGEFVHAATAVEDMAKSIRGGLK